jgi:hypothetical protein
LSSHVQREVASEASDDGIYKLPLELKVSHVAESILDNTNLGCFYNHKILSLKGPIEGFEENVVEPLLNTGLELFVLL